MLLHDVRRNKEQELWAGVSPHPLGPWVSCFVEKGMSGREPVGSELEGGGASLVQSRGSSNEVTKTQMKYGRKAGGSLG